MPAAPRPVRPLSKLLIATDFSPGAAPALTRATLLPLGPSARVTLLHVSPPFRPALRARERGEAKRRLEKEAAELREGFRASGRPDVRVRTVLAVGEPFAKILERGRRADLLLLGRHGMRRFRDLLLGSTAERIIRAGHVPVLIATAPARGPYRRPLVAVDLSPPSRRAAETAARLMLPGPPVLDIVHVYETAHDRL
ncbi:MAG TPA: universal stress protein, partial [Gemmatimonadales bacterium]|nr:universal stress protein [Gemmatimonadales bacterium]